MLCVFGAVSEAGVFCAGVTLFCRNGLDCMVDIAGAAVVIGAVGADNAAGSVEAVGADNAAGSVGATGTDGVVGSVIAGVGG